MSSEMILYEGDKGEFLENLGNFIKRNLCPEPSEYSECEIESKVSFFRESGSGEESPESIEIEVISASSSSRRTSISSVTAVVSRSIVIDTSSFAGKWESDCGSLISDAIGRKDVKTSISYFEKEARITAFESKEFKLTMASIDARQILEWMERASSEIKSFIADLKEFSAECGR